MDLPALEFDPAAVEAQFKTQAVRVDSRAQNNSRARRDALRPGSSASQVRQHDEGTAHSTCNHKGGEINVNSHTRKCRLSIRIVTTSVTSCSSILADGPPYGALTQQKVHTHINNTNTRSKHLPSAHPTSRTSPGQKAFQRDSKFPKREPDDDEPIGLQRWFTERGLKGALFGKV